MEACIDGRLDEIDLAWSDQSCLCVVMASGMAIPSIYRKGYPIRGLESAAEQPDTFVFHAGTRLENDWQDRDRRRTGIGRHGTRPIRLRDAIDARL